MLRVTFLTIATASLAACGGGGDDVVMMDAQNLARACVAAVAAETGQDASSIKASSLQPRGDTATMSLNVEGAAAPWMCDVSAAGVVDRVYFSAAG